MSIKFYCFDKSPTAPSGSGFCQKIETFLRASGYTAYTLHFTMPYSAPKGKLPYIEFVQDGKTETIADSHWIVRHLIENNIVPDLDKNLTAAQRADSRAWQAWTEELIYMVVIYQRFGIDENYAATKTTLPTLPLHWITTWFLRRNILKQLWGHGAARHTDEQRNRFIAEYVEALEARLEGVEYFHGSEPTIIDTTLCGFFCNVIGSPGNPEYRTLILRSERLKRYVATLTRRWFPEYEELIKIVEKKHVD